MPCISAKTVKFMLKGSRFEQIRTGEKMEGEAYSFADVWTPKGIKGQSRRMRVFFTTQGLAYASDSNNSTDNALGQDDATPTYYQQAPTMFFVIAGLASMLFLIIIIVAFLCYSHYLNHQQRQLEMEAQATNSMDPFSRNDSTGSFSPWSSLETPHETTPVIFVRNPGHSKPTSFAEVAPWPPDHPFSEDMDSINGRYILGSGLLTPVSADLTPESTSRIQIRRQIQQEEYNETHPSMLQIPVPAVNANPQTSA